MTTDPRVEFPHSPGQIAVDVGSSSRSALCVNKPDATPTDEYHIDVLDKTVSEANPSYPDAPYVVVAAYVDDLDGCVPGWREFREHVDADPSEFGRFLDEFEDKWGVTVRTYAFPPDRVKPVADAYAGEREETPLPGLLSVRDIAEYGRVAVCPGCRGHLYTDKPLDLSCTTLASVKCDDCGLIVDFDEADYDIGFYYPANPDR